VTAALISLALLLDAASGSRGAGILWSASAAGLTAARECVSFMVSRDTAGMGRAAVALRCWCSQARGWESPNAGPVMAAGAGALGLALGGGAYHHGRWKARPPLGFGPASDARAIPVALRLVSGALLLWMLVIIAVDVVARD